MQLRFVCSKCGQCDFASVDDLETHIVKQHFSDVDEFYECFYPKCCLRFPTESARLKHELDVHLKEDLASLTLKQMQKRYFIIQRMNVHECLNESIHMTFSGHPESNRSYFEEPSRNEGLETTSHQGPDPLSSQRTRLTQQNFNLNRFNQSRDVTRLMSKTWQKKRSTKYSAIKNKVRTAREDPSMSCAEKVGSRLVNVSVTALDPALSINKSIDRNNKTIEPEISSSLPVVKDELSLIDELADTIPSTSYRSDFLSPGNVESIDRNNETIEPETSSKPTMVKEESSMFDELADTIPSTSYRSDYLTIGNADPSTPYSMPESPRMKHFFDQSNERTEHENNFVVKDELCFIEEMDALIPCHSNDIITDPRTSSNTDFSAPSSKQKRLRTQNIAYVYAEDQKIIKPMAVDIPGPSNHCTNLTASNNGYIWENEDGQITFGHRKKRRSTLKFDENIHTTKPWLKSTLFFHYFDILLENGQKTDNVVCKMGNCRTILHKEAKLRYHIEHIHNVGKGLSHFFQKDLSQSKTMQLTLVCSKCGQCDFDSIDDLETHIVTQHFNDNDEFYECYYARCRVRFSTALTSLKHELDVHLKGDSLTLTQLQRRHFVIQRLEIHDCLNESIHVTCSGHPESISGRTGSNANTFQDSLPTSQAADSSISTLRIEISDLNNEKNPSGSSVVKVGERLISVLVTPLDAAPEVAISNNVKELKRRSQQLERYHRLTPEEKKKYNAKRNLYSKRKQSEKKMAELEAILRENEDICVENKKMTERENSSRSSVVKDEPSDELTQNIPSSSNQMLTLGNTDSIGKDNGTIDPETSSKPSVIKEEPSLMDELTSTIPAPSNCIDKLILGNADSIGKNNGAIEPETSSKPLVIKEEPSLSDESTIPTSSNHHHSYTQQTNSGGVNSSRFPENLISSERVEHANSVVKEEPIPIDELIAATFVLPNHNGSSSSNFEFAPPLQKPKRSRKQNFSDLYLSSNPSVIKNEPSLIDELAADIPGPSNYDDDLTSSTSESTALSQKPKRSRKQNFADLYAEDNKHTHPLTSSNPSVDKVEPSLIDQLAADIPGPSNHVYYLTSDDDLRVIKPKKRKLLTEEQKNTIVRLRARGDSLYDIAKIVGCSTGGVGFFLRRYRETGSIENALPNPIPRPPIKVTQEIIEAITENAKKDPWSTATDDIEMIKDRFNVSISASTAREVRNKYGLNRYTKY
ncbi:GEX Interacting protein [Ditylenchus destructor]|nr:GEX Interacting protein [Ditylenchus destructor]